jgi:nucleoside-diphosphate-sugar epimerase
LKDKPVEYVYGDLFNKEALRGAVEGVDYVYHSAGLTKAKTQQEYYRANAEGTAHLLAAVSDRAAQIRRFVHISSQAAVGPSPTRTPIDERTPPHPITTYGRSKWKAEEECAKMGNRIPITIVRPPAVYGPRDKDVFEFFHTLSMGLQPMIGFSDKYVSLIHVSDLVRGIVMAGESEVSAGQAYFISSAEIHNWKELGQITKEVMGRTAFRVRVPEFVVYVVSAFAELLAVFSPKPALINFEKARDIVQDYWTCDASKAKRDFGFEQEIPFRNGAKETVEWYRKEGWLR